MMLTRAVVDPVTLHGKIRKAAAGIGSVVALLLAASSAAQAQCAHSGALGLSPAGARLFGFGAATANVISSSITAMNTGFQTQTSAFVASPPGTQPDQFAGGTWIRGIGGFLNIDSKSNGAFVDNLLPGVSGVASCQSFARSDFFGVQGGIDLGRLDLGGSGWNIHGGITGGYFEANSSVTGGVTAISQVPFIGIYAALTGGGGFFMDAQARWDFYDITVADRSVQVPGANTKARGFSFASSAGYNWTIGNFFVEPSIERQCLCPSFQPPSRRRSVSVMLSRCSGARAFGWERRSSPAVSPCSHLLRRAYGMNFLGTLLSQLAWRRPPERC
jgi:hypothetical protein